MPKTNAETQREFYERQKERGLVKMTVYVPETDRQKLLAYAKRLRKAADKVAA